MYLPHYRFFFFNLLSFVLKVLNLPASFSFRGNSISYCVHVKAIMMHNCQCSTLLSLLYWQKYMEEPYWIRNKILSNIYDTILIIVVGKSVYSCYHFINSIGVVVLVQLFCLIRHEENGGRLEVLLSHSSCFFLVLTCATSFLLVAPFFFLLMFQFITPLPC